jgi:hypothetical protein
MRSSKCHDFGDGVVAMQRRAAHIALARAGDERDRGLDRAGQPHRDAIAGAQSAAGEIAGERIGRHHQLAIAEPPAAVAQCRPRRCLGGVAAGERVDRVLPPEARAVMRVEPLLVEQAEDRVRHAS